MNKNIVTRKGVKRRSMMQEAMVRLIHNKTAMLGFAVLFVVAVMCMCAGFICPEGYNYQKITNKFMEPCLEYPFGTDDLGRSMLARILYGGRYSLIIGFASTAVSAVIGIILGAVAGFYGGKVDNIIMRCLDVFSAIPNLLLAIAISSVMGGGLFNCILAVGISSVPVFARTVRGPFLAIREQEFVEAARSIDARDGRIIMLHIIPNVMSPIIVQVTMNIANAILTAASLSFLGLGVQAPIPEWGALLSAGRKYITSYPYLITYPGLAIASVVLAMNLFGDGLRDALDPRLKY